MKDAHIVFAILWFATGSLTWSHAMTLEQAVEQGLRELPLEPQPSQEGAAPKSSTVSFIESNQEALQEKVSKHLEASAELKKRQQREVAALQVAEVYFDLLTVHYELAASQKQVALHEEALKSNRNAGEEPAIRERLEVVKSELRECVRKLEQRTPAFEAEVGAEAGQMEIPPAVAMLQQPVITLDATLNFGYLAAREENAAHELAAEAAKLQWEPHTNLEGKEADLVLRGASPAIKSPLPSVSDSIARAEASLARCLEARSIANQQASDALDAYSQATAKIQQHAASSIEMLELANQIEAAHHTGKRSVLELLEVRNAQFRTETAFAASHIEQRRQAYRLLAATGQLVAHLDLNRVPKATEPPKPATIAVADEAMLEPEVKTEAPLAHGEIISIVEPASATEILSVGVGASRHLRRTTTIDPNAEPLQLDNVRRIGSQIVAMVEPVVNHAPTDLLPVSRDVTRRKRELSKVENEENTEERTGPFQKVFKMLKRERWRNTDQ